MSGLIPFIFGLNRETDYKRGWQVDYETSNSKAPHHRAPLYEALNSKADPFQIQPLSFQVQSLKVKPYPKFSTFKTFLYLQVILNIQLV